MGDSNRGTWSGVVNEEHEEGIYAVISEGLSEKFGLANERMGRGVAERNSLLVEGEMTQHSIQSVEVSPFGVSSD